MKDERMGADALAAPASMQQDATTDGMDAMDASRPPLPPPKNSQWGPSDMELEAAALAIPLLPVEQWDVAPRPRREKPKRVPKPRKMDKNRRRKEYKRRKDPFALVRDYLPLAVRRRRIQDAVRLDWQDEEDKKVLRQLRLDVEAMTTMCGCVDCRVVERLREAHKFVCIDLHCTEKPAFDDLLELLEHQMSRHGRISLGCTRVAEALGRKMPYHFKKTLPPPTVYVFAQYLDAAVPPTLWTDKGNVYRERKRLYTGLKHIFSCLARKYVVNAFETAALKVEARGEVELASQYEMAMEFYSSALVHLPGDAHMVDDGSFAVGPGRNWLLAPDPENAQFLNQFTYHWGDQAEDDNKGEIELFSVKAASVNRTQAQPDDDAPPPEDEIIRVSTDKASNSADGTQTDAITRSHGDEMLPLDTENASSDAVDAQNDGNTPSSESEVALSSTSTASADEIQSGGESSSS